MLKRCSPLYFEPMPNLSKTLGGLLTPLVIFVNTIFELNSLNITVSVCYVSGSKVASKPSLITVIYMNPQSPLVSFLFLYFFEFRFFLCCCCYFMLLLIFTKMILLFYCIYLFFSSKLFLFFHAPGCSTPG